MFENYLRGISPEISVDFTQTIDEVPESIENCFLVYRYSAQSKKIRGLEFFLSGI